MKILLINLPVDFDQLIGAGKNFIQSYEPLGLLYIAAVIKQSGYEVSVIDAEAEKITLEQLKCRVQLSAPDIVGCSVLTCNGETVYHFGKWLKQVSPQCTVVFGNIHASVFSSVYLKNHSCDIVIHGEGEYVFLDIIKYLENRHALDTIHGISYLHENAQEIRTSDKPAIVADLSVLPYPARELVKKNNYKLSTISNQLYIPKNGNTVKTMLTSRGCNNKCKFCVVPARGRIRFNTPKNVVDEMEFLEKEYKAEYVSILDSAFFSSKERIVKICAEYNKRKLSILWGADAHIKDVTSDILPLIERAGCYDLSFGIESGVQSLLDNVNKGNNVQEVTEKIKMISKRSKIKLGGLFILGIPGETYEDSLRTINYAKSLPLDNAQFSIFTPYPGSEIFNMLKQKNEIDTGVTVDGAIKPGVWTRYSAYISFTDNDPIWTTKDLTPAQLKKLQKRAQREFYLRYKQIKDNLSRISYKNLFKIIKIVWKGFF